MSTASEVDPFDPTIPSVARAYDYALGGKDNFESDREFAHKLSERDPDVWTSAKLNKQFGRRATEYMARRGVRQFLELGSGIPTSPPSVHDTARRFEPGARVVYVDHDPVVVAHNKALRANGPGLAVIQESFLNLDGIFSHEDFVANIDLTQPLAISFYSVLHYSARELVDNALARLRSWVAPGSYLAISHICDRTEQQVQSEFHALHESGFPWIWFRSEEEIAELFEGFELVDPGVVDYRDWCADDELADNRPDLRTHMSGGVGVLQS